MEEPKETLSFWDYLLFVLTLMMSASVGIFYSVKSWRRKTSETNVEYLLGNRKMPVIPTSMSVLTSILSSILLIGIPPEIYMRGVNAWIYTVAGSISMIINCFVFLPVFYKFQPTSVHDYFIARFNSYFLRTVVGGLFVLSTLFYMSVVLYAPAVALSKVVEGFPVWVSIVSVGFVCTFYTALGGLKAVVWADTFQTLIMFVGILVLVVKGTNDAGGWDHVWSLAEKYGRITPAKNIDPNPFQYMSLWAAIFSAIPFWLAQYGVSQMAVQRYCSLETIGKARQVIAITTPLFIILSSLPCFLGLIMFAYFFTCDPLKSGSVSTDQLVISFVMKILGQYPGLPGLFLACLCSGTLSTVSSGVNSMVAVFWEDLIPWSFFPVGIKDRLGSRGAKVASLMFGIIATGLAFTCENLGGVMKTMQSITGGFTGPLTGLFTLGILFPRANRNGAIIGFLTSVAFVIWIMIGGLTQSPYQSFVMPSYDYGCNLTENSVNFSSNYLPPVTPPDGSQYGDKNVFILYRISQWYYPIVGFLLVIIFGLLGSLIPVYLAPCDKKGETLEKHRDVSLTLQAVLKEQRMEKRRRKRIDNGEPILEKYELRVNM